MKNRRMRRTAGMTLFEIMIATAVLAIMTVALLAVTDRKSVV